MEFGVHNPCLTCSTDRRYCKQHCLNPKALKAKLARDRNQSLVTTTTNIRYLRASQNTNHYRY